MFIVQARQHHHGHVRAPGQAAQAFADRKAVRVRHHRVERDNLRPLPLEQFQRAGAAIGFDHSPSALGQPGRGQHADDPVVVDQQHRALIESGRLLLLGQRGQPGDCGFDRLH